MSKFDIGMIFHLKKKMRLHRYNTARIEKKKFYFVLKTIQRQ